ncbi:uncharacterized protein [Mytilus edulis]|uniref:uncharacterized protein n=1 Tax=Mytilus edulis TaxID=6550 RepID=UPI0039EF6802
MADTDEKEKVYYMRLLTFLLGPATKTLHLYFKMKVLDSLEFYMFLDKHKHILFHELYPTVPCCYCIKNFSGSSQKRGHLNFTQFCLLFEFIDGQEIQEHKKNQGDRITQYCLCNVSARRSVKEDDMDITLLYSVVKSCCQPGTVSGNPKWIKNIKKARNHIAHCSNPKVSESDFEKIFENIEQNVLNIASVVGRQVLKMIKDQISFFKRSDISTVQEFVTSSNDTFIQILQNITKDQTKKLTENTDTIKSEITDRLEKHKEEFCLDIRNIIFEVKTVVKGELASATTLSSEIQSPQDDDVCYVEWKLSTPSNWNVDDIKKTLENVSSLIGQWFRIVFVYKGSLVIQTSASKQIMQNDKDFRLAVKSFLKDVVKKCQLETVTNTTVKVALVVTNEIFIRQLKDEATILCDVCTSRNINTGAVLFCSECKENLCQRCIRDHNLKRLFSDHSLKASRISDVDTFQTTCSIHIDCAFELFCVDHDCVMCRYCKLEEHVSCLKSIPLKVAAKDVIQSQMFQDFSDALSNIKTTLGEAITVQNENIKNIDDDAEIILTQVTKHKARIIKRLDGLQNEIRDNIHTIRKKEKTDSETKKSQLLQIASRIQNLSVQWNRNSRHGSDKQIFVWMNICKWKFIDYESNLHYIMPILEKRRITYRTPEDVKVPLRYIGKIDIQSTQYHLDYKPLKMLQVQAPVLDSQMPTKFTLDRIIVLEGSDNVLSIGITDDNRLLICKKNTNFLLVYDECGDYLQRSKLFGQPRYVAVVPGEHKAIVTLPYHNSIQFINIKTMKPGSIHSLPDHCYSVTIVDQKICLCGIDSRCLYILDKKGNHIRTVKIPGTGYIHYLHPGPANSVYYIDFTYNVIGCVTLEGKERFRYTSDDLIEPRDVITDKKGNLYVACKGANNIQRISSNAEFIDVILDVGN